jgi:type VI secretion system secreted protein VgrG
LISQIDPEQDGKHAGAVGGHSALKAAPGSRELDTAKPVEKFAKPVMLMDGASAINWATPASTVVFAGQQLQWTVQSDMQLTAGHTVSSVAANALSLFTHDGGIQAFAGNGPVSLQAHTDQLEILADKEITVVSVNDVIEIKANQKIVLQAGQSSVTLEGGNITFACPGNFTVKGGQHVFNGGGSKAAALEPLPAGTATALNTAALIAQPGMHSLRFAFAGADDMASTLGLTDKPYKIVDESGATLASGAIGKDGRIPRQDFPKGKELTLHIGDDKWTPVTSEPAAAPADTAEVTSDANALHLGEDPYFDASLDDDSVYLDADILQHFIQNPEGEA